MTDLHTHILPGMDDGARDARTSIEMLRMEREQGVDTVVLSPHFYGDRETADKFIRRRNKSFEDLNGHLAQLPPQERESLPRLVLGAEVAWRSDLVECERVPELCIGQTKNLLLELPFTAWTNQMFNQLYDFMGRTGVMPVIAHLERYLKIQSKKHIREVLELGVPIQVSAQILTHPLAGFRAMNMLRRGQAHLLATDCHDTAGRAPDMKSGLEVVRRKLGDRRAQQLILCADELVEA